MRAGRAMLAVAALCLGCSDIDNVDVEAEGQTTVQKGTVIDQLVGDIAFLGFDGFDISQSQEFANAGYTKDQIDSVHVTLFTLTITAPEAGSFDFIQRVSFFAESDGLERVLIASLDPVPAGSNVLDLALADVDLRDYAAAESMTITTEVTGVRPDADTTIAARVVLDVDVDVSGACK